MKIGYTNLILLSLLAGCGGASTDASPNSTSLSGVAATGAALQDPVVTMNYPGGSKTCTVSDPNTGAFSCDTTGLTGPFQLSVTGTGNETSLTLLSATTSASGTVNITPITNAIVATAAGVDPSTLTFDVLKAKLDATPTALNDAKQAYQVLLADVMTATGNSGGDLLFGNLIAGNSTQDKLLDAVKLDVLPTGTVTVSTVAGLSDDTPKVLSIPITNTPAQVAGMPKTNIPTSASIGSETVDLASNPFSASDLAFLQQSLTKCFASTPAQRQSGNTICKDIAVDDIAPSSLLSGVPTAYVNNGMGGNLQFSGYFNDEGMNGARFALPQIVRVLGKDSSGKVNKAWVSFSWVRTDGIVDSIDTHVQIVKAATVSDSGWRFVGNGREVLSRVRPYASRRSWLNSASQATGTDAYVSELNISVGATDRNGNAVNFAIVTGPGLPTAGLFLRPSSGACSYLTITAQMVNGDVNGNDATVAKNKYSARPNCAARFRVAGVAVNPANQSSFTWPSTNRNWLSTPLTDSQVSAIGPFSKYNIRVYQNNDATTPSYNYTTLIRSGLIAPTDMRSYKWQDISQATLDTMDPTKSTAYAGATTFPVTWTSKAGLPSVFNVNAQIVAGAGASIVDGSSSRRPVLPGTVSTALISPTAPATSFPAVTSMVSGQGNFSYAQLQWQNSSGLFFGSTYEYDK